MSEEIHEGRLSQFELSAESECDRPIKPVISQGTERGIAPSSESTGLPRNRGEPGAA